MAAVVHMIWPTTAQPFSEYVTKHIIPYMKSHITPMISRIDAISDCYPCDSLKTLAHRRRGCGPRTKVGDGSSVTGIVAFLKIKDIPTFGTYISPGPQGSLCAHSWQWCGSTCSALFQNTWPGPVLVMLWFWKIIQTFPSTTSVFNSGHRSHWLCPYFTLSQAVMQHTSWDMERRLSGKPGCVAPKETLIDLTQDPMLLTLASIHMQRLERFVVLMYNRSYSAARVNDARVNLFTCGMRSLEKLPPTQVALFEHAKRALLQASYHWDKATTPVYALPDFNTVVKNDQGVWCPYWTSLPHANKACAILLRCGCLKSCIGNCKWSKAGILCTSLCQCEGGCINNTGDLWYHLLCSVHYGLYVNRSYMQYDKNCMDLNICGDQSLDSCTVLTILNECSCDFVTYSWVIDCWYFKLWTRLYTYIP